MFLGLSRGVRGRGVALNAVRRNCKLVTASHSTCGDDTSEKRESFPVLSGVSL
jgi:hypothetical protein